MRPKIVADASPLLRQWHRVLDDIHDKCRDDFTQKSGSELQRLMESIAVEGVLAFAEAYGTWSKDLKEQAARHADVDPGNGNRLASREEGRVSEEDEDEEDEEGDEDEEDEEGEDEEGEGMDVDEYVDNLSPGVKKV